MYPSVPITPVRERKYIAHLRSVAAKKEPAYPVSCAADAEKRAKLNIIARSFGVRVADLIATAIDLVYGDDFSETMVLTDLLHASSHSSMGETTEDELMHAAKD